MLWTSEEISDTHRTLLAHPMTRVINCTVRWQKKARQAVILEQLEGTPPIITVIFCKRGFFQTRDSGWAAAAVQLQVQWCSFDTCRAHPFPRWCWGLLLGLAGGIFVLCPDVMSHHVMGHPHRSITVFCKPHPSQNVSKGQKSPWPWTVPRVWVLAAIFPSLAAFFPRNGCSSAQITGIFSFWRRKQSKHCTCLSLWREWKDTVLLPEMEHSQVWLFDLMKNQETGGVLH